MDDDLFAVARIDCYHRLCISPLSTLAVQDADVHNLGSNRGYFIYEVDDRPIGGGITVLAKAASLEAAFRLVDLWRLKERAAN